MEKYLNFGILTFSLGVLIYIYAPIIRRIIEDWNKE